MPSDRSLPPRCSASHRTKRAVLWASLVLLSFGAVDCMAQPSAPPRGAWTVTLENDVLTGSDNNYTNGLGVSWVSADAARYDKEHFVRRWSEFWSFLPFVGDEGYRTYAAWAVAQEMHTPDDIKLADPPQNDQPYAGVLYLDSALYAKGERATHAWTLRLGVVGPASQADHVQKGFHKVIGADRPMGWGKQLPNEPILNLEYTGAYVLAQGDWGRSASWRIVPVANAGLGNYFTGLGGGIYAEFGRNLVDALGGTALRQGFNVASTVGVGPVEDWSVSLSGGLAGYAVGRYLPLDGTLFKDSPSVDSKPYVGMATIGLTARRRDLVFFLGRTTVTRTFEGQRRRADFGTASLSRHF